MTDQPHVLPLCLMGATATGKTQLAVELAKRCNGEVISVDSALVYQQMDIGTAKPSLEERDDIPHHLIDIIDAAERFSVSEFYDRTRVLINTIQERGKLPILAGGTMMYFHALLHGISELPKSEPVVRAQLQSKAGRVGWHKMHEWLAQVDSLTAQRIHANDPQRILRALEVYELTGKPMSLLQQAPKQRPGFPALWVSLGYDDRIELHKRIALRFDGMLAAGLVGEVEQLYARDDLHAELPAIRCVGYRQVWEYLDGLTDVVQMRERAIAATRQLAKRQLTWLRGWPVQLAIDVNDVDKLTKIVPLLKHQVF